MCLFFPQPKKRRYPSTSLEDPRPRKRRSVATYHKLPASSPSSARVPQSVHRPASASASVHGRYEPLRGHGIKRDPPANATTSHSSALRGHGARRAPSVAASNTSQFMSPFSSSKYYDSHRYGHQQQQQYPDLKVHFAMPADHNYTQSSRRTRDGNNNAYHSRSTRTSSTPRASATSTATSSAQHHRRKDPANRNSATRQYRSSLSSAAAAAAAQMQMQQYYEQISGAAKPSSLPSQHMTQQAPLYDYHYRVPFGYYGISNATANDTSNMYTVRDATSHALRASTTPAAGGSGRGRDQRHLRRRPAYSTLR